MTTFEHALLGINGVLATGLQRRFGWSLVAITGVAAIAPDWDGLTFLFDIQTFNAGHRVWGHNLLVCALLSLALGIVDYRLDLVTRAARFISQRVPLKDMPQNLQIRDTFRVNGYLVWIVVTLAAMGSHLAADMVVSGTAELPDWELQIWWPWSQHGYVYPLVSWGDPTIAILMVIGMFAMLRWKTHAQLIACATLIAMVVYMVA